MAELQVNLKKLRQNLEMSRSQTKDRCKIIAVVKANAYGLGAIEIAKCLEKDGIDYLAVGRMDEGIELRTNGIRSKIMVFENLSPDEVKLYIQYQLEPSVTQLETLHKLNKANCTLPIHVKFNTGMNRLGIRFDQLDLAIDELKRYRGNILSVYSHYARSDEPNSPMNAIQKARFIEIKHALCNYLPSAFFHIANSAAFYFDKDSHFDAVRLGIILYGGAPSATYLGQWDYPSIFSLTAKIIQITTVAPNETVGYGGSFKANSETRIATLNIGYADGLNRLLSNRIELFHAQKKYRLIGNISMDLSSIDITNSNLQNGDELRFFSFMENDCIGLKEFCRLLNTIPYEILSTLGKRVKRNYIDGF